MVPEIDPEVRRGLAWYFRRNGCARHPSLRMRRISGAAYKKGYEIRLVAWDEEELQDIQNLLAAAGLSAGKPWTKGSQTIQPIYGREPYERFMREVLRRRKKTAETPPS